MFARAYERREVGGDRLVRARCKFLSENRIQRVVMDHLPLKRPLRYCQNTIILITLISFI